MVEWQEPMAIPSYEKPPTFGSQMANEHSYAKWMNMPSL